MNDYPSVFVQVSCPTLEEARKHCQYMVENQIAGTAKIHEKTHLYYFDGTKVENDEVFLISLKTNKDNLTKIQKYMFENHSWKTPCIEVVPIIADMC